MTDWSLEIIRRNWKHQQREFDQHKDAAERALHWQMRTGKTKAMIDLACYRYSKGEIDGVLILAPNNVHGNWVRREIPEHHWLFPHKAMAWNTAMAKLASYDQEFKQLLTFQGLAWYAVNVEATSLAAQKPYLTAFCKRRRFMLIVDETHEWRRPGSKRSRQVRTNIAKKAVLRRNLSGTMIDNNPLHAWAQYEILKPGALGFDTFGDFERHYGVYEDVDIYVKGGRQRTIKKLVDFRNMEELRAKMAEWTTYVYRDECDDMPDLVPGVAEFELTQEQKRVYNDLVDGMLLSLASGEELDVDPETGVIAKQQMIRSGFIKDLNGDVHWLVPPKENPAFQTVLDLVNATDGKCIVWCRLRAEIEALMKFFRQDSGIIALDYYGGTKTHLRARHEDRFRDDPTVKVLVAQPKACGQGLDFSAGSHIIWFSHIHGDLIGRRQADERCTKKGGRKIAVTDMVGLGTVDEKILDDQKVKELRTDFLTGSGLREYLRIVP
jgi:SNF2 family DNA or RNA helicase